MADMGVIGFGEVGRCYAEAFAKAGHAVAACDLRVTNYQRSEAARMGVPLHEKAGDWIAVADVVVGCVEGGACLSATRDALPLMKRGSLYLDFATAEPAVKRRAGEDAAARGIAYVDVALVGAPSLTAARSPVMISGEGLKAGAAVFAELGAPVRLIDGEAGEAIALKLLRSIFTKGLEALAVDTFSAARAKGLDGTLFEILKDIDDGPFTGFVKALLRTHPLHARRRMHELQEAERQLNAAGLEAPSIGGSSDVYRRSLAAIDAGRQPQSMPTLDECLDWMLDSARRGPAIREAS